MQPEDDLVAFMLAILCSACWYVFTVVCAAWSSIITHIIYGAT